MGFTAPVASATPALSGIGPPAGAATNGQRYTQFDSNGNAVAEWLYTGGTWTLLYDTQDVVITSAEFPTRPTASTLLDRTVYINLSTKAISVTSGGVWIENVGGGGGGAPSGAAGGDLAGTYPNPTVKADVTLTGNPTAPTQTAGNNSTRIATTAFVQSAVSGGGGGSLTDGAVLPRHLSTNVRLGPFQPTGTVCTNIRDRHMIASATATPTSGTLRISTSPDAVAVAGVPITSLKIITSNAGASPTNSWMVIMDANRNVLATTQDRTTGAFSSNGTVTFTVASTIGGSTAGPWTPSSDTPIIVGLVIVATTVPAAYGLAGSSVTSAVAPAISGNADAGLTTPSTMPATATTISGGGAMFWWWAT